MAEYQPYVGPSPFERKDRHIFFGRTREANELISLIVSHSEVLLYAQSGAGKTSLINAKIMPGLEEERFEVFPLARVQGPIQGADANATKNIYVFHTLMSWAGNKAVPRKLVEVSVPDYLGQQAHPTDEEGIEKPRVVIFDQFEELFTFYPERWPERKDFFQQVREALEKDPLLRVVFSMREDHVAELDAYLHILPEKFRTRFRLERLREPAALEAVKRPVKGTNRYFADGAAESLVDDLLEIKAETPEGESVSFKDEFVEPVQLQVVCQSLWQSLPPDIQEITHERLEECADVDNALCAFYERSIKKAVERFEASEGVLRRWFEDALITPAGTRGTVFRGRKEAGGLKLDVVNFLEDEHLIRTERRGRASWYELTHDRFIQPIRDSNGIWFLRSASEQIRRDLQRRALEWIRLGRERGSLLDEANLTVAQRWLADAAANEPGYRSVLALVEASKAAIEEARLQLELAAEHHRAEEQKRLMEEQAKTTRRLRSQKAWLMVTSVVALGFAVFAVIQWAQVQKERDKATAEAKVNRAANKKFAGDLEGELNDLGEARSIYSKAGSKTDEARTLYSIGRAYQTSVPPKNENALKSFNGALLLWQSLGDVGQQIQTLNQIGETHFSLDDRQEAINSYLKALKLLATMSESDPSMQADLYYKMAKIHDELGKTEDAIGSYNEAVKLYEQLKDTIDLASSYHDLGTIYAAKAGQEQKALDYFNKALSNYLKNGNASGRADTEKAIAGIYEELGDKAAARLHRAEAIRLKNEQL
jgi:tetratricopeptide (TPR) repeat protein